MTAAAEPVLRERVDEHRPHGCRRAPQMVTQLEASQRRAARRPDRGEDDEIRAFGRLACSRWMTRSAAASTAATDQRKSLWPPATTTTSGWRLIAAWTRDPIGWPVQPGLMNPVPATARLTTLPTCGGAHKSGASRGRRGRHHSNRTCRSPRGSRRGGPGNGLAGQRSASTRGGTNNRAPGRRVGWRCGRGRPDRRRDPVRDHVGGGGDGRKRHRLPEGDRPRARRSGGEGGRRRIQTPDDDADADEERQGDEMRAATASWPWISMPTARGPMSLPPARGSLGGSVPHVGPQCTQEQACSGAASTISAKIDR